MNAPRRLDMGQVTARIERIRDETDARHRATGALEPDDYDDPELDAFRAAGLQEVRTRIWQGCIPARFQWASVDDFGGHVRRELEGWAGEPAGRNLLLLGPVGTGKAQPLDSRVLTPGGWTDMGALRVGDPICRPDGGVGRVRAVHPQGHQVVCRVATKDGGVAHTTWNHLWATTTVRDRDAHRPGQVRTLRDIGITLRQTKGTPNHWLPLPAALAGTALTPPIDPYLLGLLLGDGSMEPTAVKFTTADDELVRAVIALLPAGTEVHPYRRLTYGLCREASSGPNPLLDALRRLGLGGLRSHAKFVPAAYLHADPLIRLAVLQGLLDSDGYAAGYCIDYITTSRQLALDVRWLTQSLGGHCTIQQKQPVCVIDGVARPGRTAWRCYPVLPSWVPPFRLARKAASYTPRTRYQPHRAIAEVDEVGVAEVQCISVDGGLYITDDGLVTHNSHAAVGAARLRFDRGAEVRFLPVVELLDLLRPGGPEGALYDLADLELLVLDDLGSERPTDWTAERLYALVNRRWLEERPTICTSNLGPADLERAVGARVYSRLVGNGSVGVTLSGPDRRRNGPGS